MSNFASLQEKRRTIYALGKDLPVSNEEVVATVEKAMKESPSAFNSQSSRAVVLFGAESEAFWNEIAYSELEKVTPAEAFEATKGRLAGFAAGAGTILFFEDQDVVKGLQESFPLYAENFPICLNKLTVSTSMLFGWPLLRKISASTCSTTTHW